MSLLNTLRDQIEYAPTSGFTVAAGLVGWSIQTPLADGFPETVHICAHCAGRLIARGFRVPRPCTPVWEGAILCALCELIPFTTEN